MRKVIYFCIWFYPLINDLHITQVLKVQSTLWVWSCRVNHGMKKKKRCCTFKPFSAQTCKD